MKHRTGVALLLCLALVAASAVVAQDAGSTSPQQPDRPRPRARLIKPWSDLQTLTAEQKEQIVNIHADALDAMRKIRLKEEADILALLTPDNKAELDALKQKQRADAKSRRTTPAGDGDGQEKKP